MKMRHKFGSFLIAIGALLFLAGASLFAFNEHEARMADRATVNLLPELIAAIEQSATEPEALPVPEETEEPDGTQPPQEPSTEPQPVLFSMTEVTIGGYPYVGYVSIPALELMLPVMADWSYHRLRIAPCLYTGTVMGNDLVILAHNYKSHFGRISQLEMGDEVTFTDMDGVTTHYQVAALDVLSATAVEEMVAGEYDLTLFTCTYGGKSRVTLRCDRAD